MFELIKRWLTGQNGTDDSACTRVPAAYARCPAATADDPFIAGTKVVSSRDLGTNNQWLFTINRGDEDTAINALLDALDDSVEFRLMHGDGESATIYRKQGDRFRVQSFGHHWTGTWKLLSRASAVSMALTQARYNYGMASDDGNIHPSTCGKVEKTK